MPNSSLNPLDPNPAVAARAVFPQSVSSHPEKRPFFHIFPKKNKKVCTAYRTPIYQIKAYEILHQMQNNSFRFEKKVCAGDTLNLVICSKFGGNFEEIWGNPGEIPHI